MSTTRVGTPEDNEDRVESLKHDISTERYAQLQETVSCFLGAAGALAKFAGMAETRREVGKIADLLSALEVVDAKMSDLLDEVERTVPAMRTVA